MLHKLLLRTLDDMASGTGAEVSPKQQAGLQAAGLWVHAAGGQAMWQYLVSAAATASSTEQWML